MKVKDLLNLLEPSPGNSKNKKISKIDFLESLLKNINNKKEIKDIILHSNLTNDQKERLIQKFISQLDKNSTLDINNLIKNTLLNKKTKENSNLDTNHLITNTMLNKKTKKDEKSKESSLLASLIQNIQNPKEIIKEIKKLPQKQQSKIVIEIKFLLTNSKNPQIHKIISTKKFKEAKNFSDILNLSKEYKLNLTKIALSQIKNAKAFKNIPKIHESSTNEILTSTIKQKLKTDIKPLKTSKISLKNLLQQKTLKSDNNTKNSQNINIENLLNINSKNKEKILKNHKSKDNNSNNQFSNTIINSDIKTHIISAKQTLKHFVSSLKEAVENYKPPVSKLTLELHPKDLGKVEVTIKQRGDNLNVQINTNNTSTVNFFTTSQQDLKNSLVNMGFTNINMSFNSNHDKEQKQNQNSQKYSKNSKNNEDEELIIDFSYKYA